MKTKQMNRKDFEAHFKEVIEPHFNSNDKPALREAWNNYIDSYIKDGILPERAGNWSHPKRFA